MIVIIKSDNKSIVTTVIAAVLSLVTTMLFWQLFGVIVAMVVLGVLSVILVLNCITLGRTITMGAAGCKIEIAGVSRIYAWEEVLVKRIEGAHLGFRFGYTHGGVFFSVVPTSKPRWLDPMLYCLLRHPFSCFFVYFVTPSEKVDKGATNGIYEVEKEPFLKQLEEWGIDIVYK